MANWILDLFMWRKRNVTASAKLTARGSALMRPRSRLRGISRMHSVAAIAASSGPASMGRQFSSAFSAAFGVMSASIGRQFSSGFSGAFCVSPPTAVARQFADEFNDGFA